MKIFRLSIVLVPTILALVMLRACAQVSNPWGGTIGTAGVGSLCGPPAYSCSSTSTAVVQTPNTPPFTSPTSSGTTCTGQCINSTAFDASLNPTHDRYLRLTDNSVLSGHSPSSDFSGGDNDHDWNCAGRTDTSAACANATVYFTDVVFGGCGFGLAIQRTPSFQVVGPPPTSSGGANTPQPCGAWAWSRQNPSLLFFEGTKSGDPKLYSTTYSWDGTVGHVPTFTAPSVIFDFGVNCPLPNGIAYGEQWSGPVTNDITDTKFSFSTSNVRGIPTANGATATVANGSTSVTIVTNSLGTIAANAGGSGYAVGDSGNVTQGGASGGIYIVTSIGGGGAVTGLSIVNIGKNYSTANGLATTTTGVGSGLTVNIQTGLLTDGSLTLQLIGLGAANTKYTIQSNTLTTVTLTSGYLGTDCSSSCAMSIPSGQGTGEFTVAYNSSGPWCTVVNWQLGSTSCSGTGCPASGTLDNGCHGMDVHDSFGFEDGQYVQISGASTGINCGNASQFWNFGTTHAVACTGTISPGGFNLCGGHNTFGYHNERTINNPNFYQLDPSLANTYVNLAPFGAVPSSGGATNCENHFSWDNASAGDTQAIIGSTANPNYQSSSTTSTWVGPTENEVFGLFGNGTLVRFGHNFILGPDSGCGTGFLGPFGSFFNAKFGIGTVSQDGGVFKWSSDMLGQLGVDVDGTSTRADVFAINLD